MELFDPTTLFDAQTLKGLVALVSLHWHLRTHTRAQKAIEGRVALLEKGHNGNPDNHRELGEAIAAAEARR